MWSQNDKTEVTFKYLAFKKKHVQVFVFVHPGQNGILSVGSSLYDLIVIILSIIIFFLKSQFHKYSFWQLNFAATQPFHEIKKFYWTVTTIIIIIFLL